jgi:hypothetical protein
MPRDLNRDPNKPLSMAERFKKTHGVVTYAQKVSDPFLSPGKADKTGVMAAGLGLKHSE